MARLRMWFPVILVASLAVFALFLGATATDSGGPAQASLEDSNDILTSATTIEYAFASTSGWENFHTVVVTNGVGTDCYLKFWATATTGTVSNTDFHAIVKTSETLVLGRPTGWSPFPVRTVGVYQKDVAYASSYTLRILGYR